MNKSIITNKNEFVKVEDAIVDFTFLSKKDFVGEIPIKNFVNETETRQIENFAKNTGFDSIFKKLGVVSFEWEDIHSFLLSENFASTFNISKNIKLIKHFKHLADTAKINNISIEKLSYFSFIIDHKNHINYPNRVCFPAADDQNWNNPNSELSFLHPELQDWLLTEPEMRIWLESLGMIEKTDITYITQTILPRIDSYVTLQNANQTIQDLFILYKKEELKKDLIERLSKIKLLTQKGTLRSAKECYFSDFYSPRLSIEKKLEKDIFVSKEYCSDPLEKDEWKRFFKMFGVKGGISILSYPKRYDKETFVKFGYKDKYFDDKKFKPYRATFSANAFKHIKSLSYIHYTENNLSFAINFWQDVIQNYSLRSFNTHAIAFWGYDGRAGQTNGDKVDNYVIWYIQNANCIPVLNRKCEVSSSVFLNSEKIKHIAGNYLPVFNGRELSPDWKNFFKFKTSLQLTDYLELLEKIASDVDENGKIKNANFNRVQSIYYALLEICTNWSETEILQVKEWAKTGQLLNTKRQFTECKTLKYFLDGNNSIFQEQFHFLKISAENKKHSNLEVLLNHFTIQILKQSDFKLAHTEKEPCFSLINRLKFVIPYFKIWIEHETENDIKNGLLERLQYKVEVLNIYKTEELCIKYPNIDFIKSVNVHFNNTNLFVTNPWNANSVLLKLPEVLCRYFHLIGHDKKLDFLLRSNNEEIQEYFIQEEINIPKDLQILIKHNDTQLTSQRFNSFADIDTAINEGRISPEFFHLSKPEYDRLKYVEELISRAITNITNYLISHPEYDCQSSYEIAPSIIGGITKNGNEITVVARPSDNEEVLLYYTSEFDVLEYVDAEFWYEDGINLPKQITLGQLFKKTGINRIPVKNINISASEIDTLLNTSKNEKLDFNPVPFVPQKIAKIISSFANTDGGSLIFGLKEISPTVNEIVGLSADFKVVEITKKAVSLLSPIPNVTYDWRKSGEESVFIIKTEKAENNILLEGRKYLREEAKTLEEIDTSKSTKVLVTSQFKKTIAIIIGIENYLPRNKILPVKYAHADALKFKDMLIKKMNIGEEDILMLTNEDANENTIKYELNRLFPYLTQDDRLIFYYVGHGFHNGVTNYLSTYNTHTYNTSETSMSLSEILFNPLKKSKCKTALIFIDACAKSFQGENERSIINDINDEEFKLLNNEFPYYATFLSCHSGQKSYSSDILKNGIWTHHLVEAISGNVPEIIKDNKYITDASLRDYLSINVAKYTKEELGYDQNPKAILDASNENIIVEVMKNLN